MKQPKKTFALLFSISVITACGTDTQTQGSVTLENASFAGNKLDYDPMMNGCGNLTTDQLAQHYEVQTSQAIADDFRFAYGRTPDANSKPGCTFRITFDEDKYDYLSGGASYIPDVKDSEGFNEVMQIQGHGENWLEAWELDQQISGSETVPDIGKAALWNSKKRELKIRFEGYTAFIVAPGSAINAQESAKNRDYKSIAISLAKQIGL